MSGVGIEAAGRLEGKVGINVRMLLHHDIACRVLMHLHLVNNDESAMRVCCVHGR